MLTKEKMMNDEVINGAFQREILFFISQRIKNILMKTGYEGFKNIEEIRLRTDKPLVLQNSSNFWFVNQNGEMTKKSGSLFIVNQDDIVKTLELMSENSVYAYQDEIKNGFITLRGGHRVGIAGRVILDVQGIRNIRDISGLNIRIAREVVGCSSKILRYVLNGPKGVYNTLIVSPPQCGKTTILRDMARVISDGTGEYHSKGLKVGIVDERSEIAACFKGVPQHQVGIFTDVMDGCPKSVGMLMLLRSMSPQVIITDEIGAEGDMDAVMKVINAGIKIITTAHGYNISELKSRQEVLKMMEGKVFERYIVLSNLCGPGTVEEVIDGTTMEKIAGREG